MSFISANLDVINLELLLFSQEKANIHFLYQVCHFSLNVIQTYHDVDLLKANPTRSAGKCVQYYTLCMCYTYLWTYVWWENKQKMKKKHSASYWIVCDEWFVFSSTWPLLVPIIINKTDVLFCPIQRKAAHFGILTSLWKITISPDCNIHIGWNKRYSRVRFHLWHC